MGAPSVMAGRLSWHPNVRLIEEARLRRCWTLRQLSYESGVSYPTIINLIGRRVKPTFGTLDQVAKALDLASAQLVIIVDHSRLDKASTPSQMRLFGT